MSTNSQQLDFVSFPAVTYFPRDGSDELVIPLSAHTLDGFREWALSDKFPERGRFTYVAGGLIVDMSPELFETHLIIKTEITAVLYRLTKERRLGRVLSDGCLLSNPEAGISTEPDATFATFDSFQSGRCEIVRSNRPGVCEELIGSPDWLMEIISPTSQRKDKKLLRDAYFRAGIPEYWLIDALGDLIEFQILVPGENGYVPVDPNDGWLASPTFGCSFRLTREKEVDGFWQYTLHIQEKS